MAATRSPARRLATNRPGLAGLADTWGEGTAGERRLRSALSLVFRNAAASTEWKLRVFPPHLNEVRQTPEAIGLPVGARNTGRLRKGNLRLWVRLSPIPTKRDASFCMLLLTEIVTSGAAEATISSRELA